MKMVVVDFVAVFDYALLKLPFRRYRVILYWWQNSNELSILVREGVQLLIARQVALIGPQNLWGRSGRQGFSQASLMEF